MDKLGYAIKSFCNAYGIGRTTAYQLVRSGELELIKIGACSRITAESAERYHAKLIAAARRAK